MRYERGIIRARKLVEDNGQAWSDIVVGGERKRLFRLYGIPNAVSEAESEVSFGDAGSLYIDDSTELYTAYVPSDRALKERDSNDFPTGVKSAQR